MVQVAAVNALKRAEAMKEKIQATSDLLADNDTWMVQQQLQRLYQKVLILDLEYALDKKVEQDLWNHGFKQFIGNLQAIVKDKKHPKRTEGQAMLHWCLEAASGSYLCLLQEISAVFNLDLPFRRRGTFYGCTTKVPSVAKEYQPSKISCNYICQYCLVHLGDIARYRNQNKQAETYYRYAVMLSPASGQPYNQLAILEASRGDKLSTVYHYVRAVSLSHPFPAASTNLSRTFDKYADYEVKLDGHSKMSSHEYVAAFLKFHGLLHTHMGLDVAEKLVQLLTTSLTAHIATESLSAWKLVQIVAINIYALQQVIEGQLTDLEMKVKNLIAHLLAGCLNALLLPVYTITANDSLLDFFAMPAIKMTLEWIRLHPDILETAAFQQRLQIWPSLCRLLNGTQSVIGEFSAEKYKHVPLPEDRDLQGFLPFESIYHGVCFKTEDLKTDVPSLNKLRARRVMEFGTWLAMSFEHSLLTILPAENGVELFEPVSRPEPPGDLLREFEQLALNKITSPTLPDNNGTHTSSSTPDSVGFLQSCLETSQESLPEKRPGILKSDINHVVEGKPIVPGGRHHRNVALASIMSQKLAEEVKQVTFKTPSPNEKEKTQVNHLTNKKNQIQLKQNKGVGPVANDSKGRNKEKVIKPKPDSNETQNKSNSTLLKQQKLMSVLVNNQFSNEQKNEICDKKETPKSNIKPKKPEQKQEKQQLLTAIFDASKTNEQTHAMSGVLTLNKQQQELLTSSKNYLRQQQQNIRPQPHHKAVDKMEAARKEYEDAMVILQQRRQEQERMRFAGPPEPFSYERMLAPPPPVQSQPMFLTMSPPVAMQPFAFKYRPEVMIPWHEPEQPPVPPPTWWTERPPMTPVDTREQPVYPHLSTYSLFSNPMSAESDPNFQKPGRIVNPQSFWSGPGPSPLERLLQQQRKQMEEAPPNT